MKDSRYTESMKASLHTLALNLNPETMCPCDTMKTLRNRQKRFNQLLHRIK